MSNETDNSTRLTNTGTTRRGGDKSPHLIVEGDNLTVLHALSAAWNGKVDLIYIDPPYNTGSTDRKYQDNFSEWLEFMRPRLEVARDLLSPLGVIVIAIGDDELARLRLLADDIFGAKNFLSTIVWQGGIANSARFTGGGIDYMIAYGLSRAAMVAADITWREPKPGLEQILEAGRDAWSASGGDARDATQRLRLWWKTREHDFAGGMHEYSRVDEDGRVFRIGYLGAGTGRGGGNYEVTHPHTKRPVLAPPGDWICKPSTMAEYIADGRVLFGVDETTTPSRKLFLDEMGEQAPLPSFAQRRDTGTKHLENILGSHRFSNPKDHLVLARWFAMMAPADAVILDFFAGSGTTAEAAMQLNHADGGTRRTILITNNEVSAAEGRHLTAAGLSPGESLWEQSGVFRAVTRPRIETIVTGLRADGTMFSAGYPENVEFFILS